MCTSCLAVVPAVTLRLLATSVALLYGQRRLFGRSQSKWTRRLTLGASVLISLALAALGTFLLALNTSKDYRRKNFAGLCVSQNLRSTPLDEYRCSILEEGNVSGRVLEFGPGPGTNFKCFANSTMGGAIEGYVAVEPNPYFEEEIRRQRDVQGLTFPLEFRGIRGEDVGEDESGDDDGSFDVVVMTHVLCSVDSVGDVLANAERALRPGGRIVFMEHVVAEEGTLVRRIQRIVAPVLNIVGNGCEFRNMGDEIGAYLDNRFEVSISSFDAPVPAFLYFVKPHIKGIAIKK